MINMPNIVIELEKIQQRFRQRISPSLILNLSEDHVYNCLELEIKRHFYGERKEENHIISFQKPATWWEHFKEAKFPQWLLSRYPVKYVTETAVVTLSRAFEFPDAYHHDFGPLAKFIIHDNPVDVRWTP